MAEHDDWTAADDARVRAALTSLRTDVESAPLPDVRFVKARGMARRRHRFLAVGAAAAVAAVVAGTVGWGVLRPEGNLVNLPAARTSTTTTTAPAPSPTTSSSLDQPGLLPLAQEWETSLDLPAGSVRLEQAKTLEGGVECADALGKPTLQQSMTQTNSPVSGAATYWATGGDKNTMADLEQSVAKCQAGPGFTVTAENLDIFPRFQFQLYSYSTTDAGSGWFAAAAGEQGVALLQLIDPAFPDVKSGGFTKQELAALAAIEVKRLDRYAKSSASPTTTTSTTARPTVAVEKMTIYGPDPLPSAALFVPPSQWKNPRLANGSATVSDSNTREGSTSLMACETADQQAGIAGRVGVVGIAVVSPVRLFIGQQRVRVFDDVKADALVAADLARTDNVVMKGCQATRRSNTTAVAGPTKGTYLLTTDTGIGGTTRQWVGTTAMRTPGGVTTVTFYSADSYQDFEGTDKQGFAELERLLTLARQK